MTTSTEKTRRAARRAIKVLGGVSAAARVLDVKDHRHQTVQSWLRNRVPAEYCPAIERETRAVGKPVLCDELRPDVDWGVLRATHPPLGPERDQARQVETEDA